ncbi:TPA: hypothetical protein ACRVL0_002698, partial [Staphylococcus aureus]
APTQGISKRNSTDNASWGGGPNTENFEKKFYKQCKLGWGPEQREIGFPISTVNAIYVRQITTIISVLHHLINENVLVDI